MSADGMYEFDCPQFIDFSEQMSEEHADDWFEEKVSQAGTEDTDCAKENDGRWSTAGQRKNYKRPKLGLTIPKTPLLLAKHRSRPITVLSRKDQEEKELTEMKNYHFRARPVNENILKPVKAIEKKEVAETRKPGEKRKMVTANSTSKRMALMPHAGVPANKVRNQDGHLVPKPFYFEDADRKRKEKREAKLREIYEKEKAMRDFKALPVPTLSPKPVAKSVKPPTVAEPFKLESVERHEYHKEKWQRQLKEEEDRAKRDAKFVARPCTVTSTSPFVPDKSNKPLTVPFIELHSERRGVERKEFDERMKALEKEREDLERERAEWRRQEEELAIAEIRASTVHKPLPLPHFPQPLRVESGKELTIPKSPGLGLRRSFRKH